MRRPELRGWGHLNIKTSTGNQSTKECAIIPAEGGGVEPLIHRRMWPFITGEVPGQSGTKVVVLRRVLSPKRPLYLPAPCISEARSVIRRKHQPREADELRKYLKWAIANGHIDAQTEENTRRVLDRFENLVKNDLDVLEDTLLELRKHPGLEVFGCTDAMLECQVSLATEKLDLKPFDLAILSAVLTRAEELKKAGETDVVFCDLDSDLQPWDKYGVIKPVLKQLYDDAHIWVYGDFTLTTPEPPASW